MRTKLFALLFLLLPLGAVAQSAESTFHVASNQYIHNKMNEAKRTLEEGLRKYPNDPKLNALRSKIKDEEKQKQDQNQNQDQNQDQKDQQQKDDEKNDDKQNQEKQGDQDKKEQEEKKAEQQKAEQQDAEQQKDEQKEKELQNFDPSKFPNIPIEKMHMILEAMRNQEKQYLQQNKRKATKSRSRGKPDW